MDKAQQLELERKLENWGAWARGGALPGQQRKCGSAEGRYVSPVDDADDRRASIARPPVLVGEAEELDRCVSRLRDVRMRRVLEYRYVYQYPQWESAKRLDIRPPMLVEPLRLAALGALQYHVDHAALPARPRRVRRAGLQSPA